MSDRGHLEDIMLAAQNTTAEYIDSGRWHDGITGDNKLLYIAKKMKMNKLIPNTFEARGPITLLEANTFEYSGNDPLQRKFEVTEQVWRYFSGIVATAPTAAVDQLEDNDGKNRETPLWGNKVMAARASLGNRLRNIQYRSGLTPNRIVGIAHIYPVGGMGRVGGIDSAVYPNWQSHSTTLDVASGSTPDSTTVINGLSASLRRCMLGTTGPNVMIVTDPMFALIQAHMNNLVEVMPTDEEKQVSQFKFRFCNARFDWDVADNFDIDEYKAYFFRSEDLNFYYHGKTGFRAQPVKHLEETDSISQLIKAKITTVCKNRRHGGQYNVNFT